MQCPSVRTLSFVVGGINVLSAALLTIRVLVHLAVYSHVESQKLKYDAAEEENFGLGMASLILLFIFAAVWLVFSSLLIKGIYEERYKLMSFWIYLNYVIMAVIFSSAAVAFIMDCIHWTSFREILVNLLLYALGSGLSFLIFYPVFILYKTLQINTEQQALKDSEDFKPIPSEAPRKASEEFKPMSSTVLHNDG